MSGPLDKPHEHSANCSHEQEHEHFANCTHDHAHKHSAACSHEQESRSLPSAAAEHARETLFSRIVGLMDIAGVFASTICLIHCLLMPVVMALLPVVARPLMHHDWVHVGLAGFVLAFCLIAYIPGYLQHHDRRLIYTGTLGISLVFFATFVARAWGEVAEASIITAGNTIIIFGHLLNRRLLAHLKCQHKHI